MKARTGSNGRLWVRRTTVLPLVYVATTSVAHAQTDNTAMGSGALSSNTTGDYNAAFGHWALKANTTGSNNTALGDRTLSSNQSGSYNTAAGQGALYSNQVDWNTAIGFEALVSNTFGDSNTALGAGALYANIDGHENTAAGIHALETMSIEHRSTAIGAYVLNHSDQQNTAVGWAALYNTASVGDPSTGTGKWNSVLGAGAMQFNTTGSLNAAAGFGALGNNTSGKANTAAGRWALLGNSSGNDNVAVGFQALQNNQTGSGNVAIGKDAGPSTSGLSNTVALGNGAVVTASNTIRFGNSAVTSIGGQVAWSNLSDARFKLNVRENVPGIDFISKLRPVTYTWDLRKLDAFVGGKAAREDDVARDDAARKVHTGFLAQEVETAAARSEFEFSGVVKPANDRSLYELRYAEFVVPLVKTIQGQQSELAELDQALALLELQNLAGNAEGARDGAFASTFGGLGPVAGLFAMLSAAVLALRRGRWRRWTASILGSVTLLAAASAQAQTDNTAYGSGALGSVTTGDSNAAFGHWALKVDSSGSYNTAFGDRSLTACTARSGNTAIGQGALYANTAEMNTAVGEGALAWNTTGMENVGFGATALGTNVTGGSNTAVGYGALQENLDSQNTAVGMQALFQNTSGANNTAVGARALEANQSGWYNTALGASALKNNTSGQNNTALGNLALSSCTTAQSNTALGASALRNTTGSGNTGIGVGALDDNVSGTNNTAVGRDAGPSLTNLSNTTAFGMQAVPSASNRIRIGNSGITQIGGQVGWSNLSDARFKTNVVENVPGLDFVMKLRPVTFRWDAKQVEAFNARGAVDEATHTGFLAQEVEAAAEGCRFDFSAVVKPEGQRTPYELSYAEFVVPLVKAAQEQQQEIEALKRTVADLQLPRATGAKASSQASMAAGLLGGGFGSALGVLGALTALALLLPRRARWTGLGLLLAPVLAVNTAHAQVDNTAFGSGALGSNTTGSSNSAFGHWALKVNTSGLYNTAIGDRTLLSVTTTEGSTAVGQGAAYSNRAGWITAAGVDALNVNTTGCCNTALGATALSLNVTGAENTAVGMGALRDNTGSSNTAVGAWALSSNTSGVENTAVGSNALNEYRTASSNTAFGSDALYGGNSNPTGSSNTAIGDSALTRSETGLENTAFGFGAADELVGGSGNVAVGMTSLGGTPQSNNTVVGTRALEAGTPSTLNNAGALGFLASVGASNTIRIGNTSITQIGGQVGWSNLSDARLKKDVREDVPGLEFITKLRPVTFTWDMRKLEAFTRKESLPESEAERVERERRERQVYTGFIAQEVEAAAKRAKFEFSGVVKPATEGSSYELRYAEFVVPLVKAVQQQQQQIERLKKTAATLQRLKLEGRLSQNSGAGDTMQAGFLTNDFRSTLLFLAAVAGLAVLKRRRAALPLQRQE